MSPLAGMIRRMSLTDVERENEMAAALADAGYANAQVRFYALDELGATDHVGAAWFRPWMTIEEDDRHFLNDALRAEANRPADRKLHRIIVPAHPVDRVEFAALLRHELEHARQFDALGVGVFDLQDFIEHDVLVEVAGGLNGCAGGLINAVPTEIDCNAAASVYITGRFTPDEVARLRGGDRRFLACSLIPPASHDTLIVRMIAFVYIHREAVERHCARRDFPVPMILDSVHRGAGDIWRRFDESS
jgi:hypothetical protein